MKVLPVLRKFFWVLLLPVSLCWAMLMWFRRHFFPNRKRYVSSVPVLCIGNLHSGGSGKTPIVAEVARNFSDLNPIILSRGYRGELSKQGAVLDREEKYGASIYGDEPWMLAQLLPNEIVIGRDRVQRLQEIESKGRPVILDDGFQHLAVKPNCSIIVINATNSTEDAFCLPLGDLREPLSALREASAVILVYGAQSNNLEAWRALLDQSFSHLPVFMAKRICYGLWDKIQKVQINEGEKIAAFSGIAQPQGFLSELLNISSVEWMESFSDHHPYSERELLHLTEKRRATEVSALVTTEKDWFKVHEWFEQSGDRLLRLRIGYEISPEFWYFLKKHWVI